jgi:hypothetical protein
LGLLVCNKSLLSSCYLYQFDLYIFHFLFLHISFHIFLYWMRYSYRCEVGQITAVERAVARDLEGSQTEGRGGSTLLDAVHIRPHRFTTRML